MWLKGRLSILVVTEVIEQLLHRLCKSFVLRIFVELVAQEFELVKNTVSMVTVTITKKEVATVIELVPFISSLIFHDVTLLLQAFPDISIHVPEPCL